MGYDPVGYVPFDVPATPYLITTHRLERTYNESTFFTPTGTVADVQDDFLAALKSDLDTNYAATNFTDAARNYILDYQVVKVERVYVSPINSMWQPRVYNWVTTIQVRVNTDA